ncbi:MAG TPA: type I-C CRISPR-associated endonuclease Cas1c [Ktedonobacterales bacterium]
MHELLNTLYVTTEQSYLHLDHDTIRMEVGGTTTFRMPLLHLGSIVCFGNVLISPALMHRCARDGRALVLLDASGRFQGRMEGPVSGNVLLRQAQYAAALDEARTRAIARSCVAGKLQNGRQVLLRGGREARDDMERDQLGAAADVLAAALDKLPRCGDLDTIRGCEGEAARAYFDVFGLLVREDRETFTPHGRTRRPPLDRMNALLSFLYTLLTSDCVAAAEGVGLDPQLGYLHALRPGRPALALDLMEELRSVLADRLALALVNRRQLTRDDFVERDGGAVTLTEKGRKTVLVAYQQRKQDEVQHRVLGKRVPLGLVPHVQARLLARHLRGDAESYLPFLYR